MQPQRTDLASGSLYGTLAICQQHQRFHPRQRQCRCLKIYPFLAMWDRLALGGVMLDRFTVSSLIKSVIVLMALCMTGLLSFSAWNSWGRLAMTEPDPGGRGCLIESFQGDAQSSQRPIDHQPQSERRCGHCSRTMQKYLRSHRDAELSAMRSAAAALASIEFADQKTLVPELEPADPGIYCAGSGVVGRA